MPEETVKPLKESPMPFHLLLARLEGGLLHAELSGQLNELNGQLATLAAQNGKAKGAVTLKLSLTHQRNGMVEVTADVKTDAPKVPRESSIFFVTEGSNLSVDNPKQPSLPLRSVESPQAPPREVAGAGETRKL